MFYFRMDGAEISLIDGKRELRFMSGRDKKHSRHVPHDKKYQLTTATEPVFFSTLFFLSAWCHKLATSPSISKSQRIQDTA